MRIRIAKNIDRNTIHSVHWAAFAEDEREVVAKLAVSLLAEKTTPLTISLVAVTEGDIVGHVAFSPVTIENDTNFHGYILAPLGIQPKYQKRSIGSQLIRNGMQKIESMGADMLFVYGDPAYYSRFGFSEDAAKLYVPPYKLKYPFGWQGIIFKENSIRKSSVTINCVASLCDPELW